MTTIPQLMGEITELKRDVLYYKNRYERIRNERDNLKNKIDKTTNYYLKTLAKNGSMPDEAVEMFNLLEGNK